jgi:hypothetical protein
VMVSPPQAQAWRQPALANCPSWTLAAPGAPPLMRVIELSGVLPRLTRHQHGWLALEVLVRDVDALAPQVAAAGFDIVGPPADLDVSPAIRAMQALGPAGEMLYLTEVKAPVPPFEIPLSATLPAGQALGPLFIAVLSTPSRAAVLAALAPLAPKAVLSFETKITVLNRALGHELGKRWPVATVQWAGQSLFEVDEVVDSGVNTASAVPQGLAWVTMVGQCEGAGEGASEGAGEGAINGAINGLFEISPGAWLEFAASAAPVAQNP